MEPKDVAAFDAGVLTLLLAILETCAPRLDLELIVALPTPVVVELQLTSELLVPAIVAVKRKKIRQVVDLSDLLYGRADLSA